MTWLLLYVFIGTITSMRCFYGIVKALQSGVVTTNGPERAVVIGLVTSALLAGVGWPIYWLGLGVTVATNDESDGL